MSTWIDHLIFQMPSTPQMRKANEKNAKNVTKRGQVWFFFLFLTLVFKLESTIVCCKSKYVWAKYVSGLLASSSDQNSCSLKPKIQITNIHLGERNQQGQWQVPCQPRTYCKCTNSDASKLIATRPLILPSCSHFVHDWNSSSPGPLCLRSHRLCRLPNHSVCVDGWTIG